MAKKEIIANVCEEGTWHYVPDYKIMLVRDSNERMPGKKHAIKSPDDMVTVFQTYLSGADRENFVIAMLDRKGNILGLNTVSVGSISSSIVHPREVFKPAIVIGASSLILCHNHPSGDTHPSREDKDVTKRLIECGKLLGIDILDHIIVGNNYYSFRENRDM